MKRIVTLLVMLQLGLLAGLAQIVTPEPVWRQAYQGTLSSNGVPVNVPHDVVLSLWAGPLGGTQIGAAVTNSSVPVTNGQFSISPEPWDSNDLSYTNLHVQIALRRTGSGAPYVTLSPRQRLASVPQATVAARALTISSNALSTAYLGTNGVDGAIIAPGSLSGDKLAAASVVKSFNGLKDGVTLQATDDLELTTVGNVMTLKALVNCQKYIDCYWGLLGNFLPLPSIPPQTFNPAGYNWLGTADAKALELRVNTQRGLRLEPPIGNGAPNFIGGYWQNVVTPGVYSATIGGGGSGTGLNRVSESYGTVAGGSGNVVDVGATYGTVGGGGFNLASGYHSTVAGGARNSATDKFSFIGGGASNVTEAVYATIAGGLRNTNSAYAGSIGGGDTNRIQVNSRSATIGGGEWNIIQSASPFATVGGGRVNKAGASDATIGGGAFNTNSGISSTIGGGDHNLIPSSATISVVAGGRNNVASGDQSVIGGGQNNRTTTTGSASVVGGGFNNEAGADTSTIGGGVANVISAVAANAMIGGGANNYDSAIAATIGGGIYNTNAGISSTISGGEYNVIPAGADRSTVAGGHLNIASGPTATVGGGSFNTAVAPNSTIPGGLQALTRSYGQQAYASGQFANPGDAQSSLYISRNVTQNATPTELFLDGVAGTARMKVPVNGTWAFQTLVVARDNLGPSYNSAGWRIEGVVEHYGVGTFLIGTPTVTPIGIDPGAAAWTVNTGVWGSGANAGLSLTVTGGTAVNPVRWVATTRTSEVVFP